MKYYMIFNGIPYNDLYIDDCKFDKNARLKSANVINGWWQLKYEPKTQMWQAISYGEYVARAGQVCNQWSNQGYILHEVPKNIQELGWYAEPMKAMQELIESESKKGIQCQN